MCGAFQIRIFVNHIPQFTHMPDPICRKRPRLDG